MALVECMVTGGVRPATATDIADEIAEAADLDQVVYWYSKQQRQQAYTDVRKQQVMEHIDKIVGELSEGELADPKVAAKAVMSLITRSDARYVTADNVESATRRATGIYHSRLVDMISRFRSKPSKRVQDLFLSGDPEGEALLVRAIYGEKIDDPDIEAFAKEWLETVEEMRKDFNAAGGWIDKLEDWRLPQTWDAVEVRKKFPKPEDWVQYMLPKLDRTKMKARDIVDGKKLNTDRPMTDEEVIETLRYSYQTIVNDGHNKIDPMAPQPGRAGINNKYNHERVIHLNGAEAWLEMHTELGRGNDVFDMLMGHVDRMAMDIGTLEVMPPAAFETAIEYAKQLSGGSLKDGAEGWVRKAYQNASGRLEQGTLYRLGQAVQDAKNIVTAGKLGNATIMAIADTVFNRATSKLNGLSPARVFGKQLRMMFSGEGEELKQQAIRIGLTADAWVSSAHAHSRFGDNVLSGGTGKLAQSVLRGSLLTSWTQSGRLAFQMEAAFDLAQDFGKTFDQLSRARQNAFSRYGIGEKQWDAFRKQGAGESGLPDLRTKEARDFHRMISTEVDFAVPTPDARVKAVTNWGYGSNSGVGMVGRVFTNLKSFPITIMTTHWQRAMADRLMSPMEKTQYAASIVAQTTLMGMAIVYAKDIIAGKEPMDLDDTDNLMWLANQGLLAGGSLGLAGDFFVADPYAYGNAGYGDKLTNVPLVGMANDFTTLMPHKYLTDEDYEGSEYALDIVEAVRRNAPSVWWVKPFTNAVGEAMEEAVAPRAAREKQQRLERKEKKERGRGYYDIEDVL